jgi:hypothetical protein
MANQFFEKCDEKKEGQMLSISVSFCLFPFNSKENSELEIVVKCNPNTTLPQVIKMAIEQFDKNELAPPELKGKLTNENCRASIPNDEGGTCVSASTYHRAIGDILKYTHYEGLVTIYPLSELLQEASKSQFAPTNK